MADMLARVTGRVLNTTLRSGNKDGREWSFFQVDVLVADRGVTTVTTADDMERPREGDNVDLLCRITSNQFGPRLSAFTDFPVFTDLSA